MKLIFHHIPKTAGTTLIGFLDQHYAMEEILPSNYFNKPARDVTIDEIEQMEEAIMSYNLIRAHFPAYGFNSFPEDAYRITVLRNPTKRIFSLFNDWRSKSDESLKHAHPDDIKCVKIAQSYELTDFLKHLTHPIQALFDNGQVRLLSGSMRKETLDNSDLEKAKETLKKINLVGTTEMLDVFINILCAKFNWIEPERLQALNKRSYDISEFDQADKDILFDHIKWDNELYLFAKSLFKNSILTELKNAAINKPKEKVNTTDSYSLDMLKGFKATGFHVREGLDTNTVWRWTGPTQKSTVALNLTLHNDYQLLIDIISVIDQEILEGVKLILNNHSLEVINNGIIDGKQQISAKINRDYLNDFTEDILEIIVPYTVSHAERQPETLDHRQKGIAITKIEVNTINY